MTEMEITYREVDVLLYPNIQMPTGQRAELMRLGKYRRMTIKYEKRY